MMKGKYVFRFTQEQDNTRLLGVEDAICQFNMLTKNVTKVVQMDSWISDMVILPGFNSQFMLVCDYTHICLVDLVKGNKVVVSKEGEFLITQSQLVLGEEPLCFYSQEAGKLTRFDIHRGILELMSE